MLQNAYLLAKIGADTAENERKFAENLPKFGNYPQVHTSVRKLNLLQAKLRSLDLGANRVAAAGIAALASALPQSAARGLEVGTLSFFFFREPRKRTDKRLSSLVEPDTSSHTLVPEL